MLPSKLKFIAVAFVLAGLWSQVVLMVKPVVADATPNPSGPVLLAQTTPQPASSPVVKYKGPEKSIQEFLCAPSDASTGTALYSCIGRLYRFGIAAGALSLVFFVVLAGYFYITGSENGKKKGKDMVFAALTGMAILVFSYVLLRFINPNLAQFRIIQPPIFNATLPSCEQVGFGQDCAISSGPNAGQVFYAGNSPKGYAHGNCQPVTNKNSPATVEKLKQSCWGSFGDEVVRRAAIVAARESGGVPKPVSEGSCGAGKQIARCVGGEIPVYGVFQINLMAHQVPDGKGNTLNCPDAFAKTKNSFCTDKCTVKNADLYKKCWDALHGEQGLQNEFNVACDLYTKNLGSTKKRCAGEGANRVCGNNQGFDDWGNVPNAHGRACGF